MALTYKKTYFTVFQSFNEKLSQQKNILSSNKPTNEDEDEKVRQSLEAAQKNLGITVEKAEMPLKMQSFIIDAVIVHKLKHSGNCNEISSAIKVKMDGQYGSGWNVLITNHKQSAHHLTIKLGYLILLKDDFCYYSVFKSG